MTAERFLRLCGFVFLFWGIADIMLKIVVYDLRGFEFLWFCTVGLFLLSFGLILRSAMLLNSFLSLALVVQLVWALDYLGYAFSGQFISGLASYAFEPGYLPLEFISNTRHLLMIPFGFFGVALMSRPSRGSYYFIPGFVVGLLGITYFLTPNSSNLNCVFTSCVDALGGLSGFRYFFAYAGGIVLLALGVNFLINLMLRKARLLQKEGEYRRIILSIFILLVLICALGIIFSSVKYAKIPSYRCGVNENCVDCGVSVECKYIQNVNGTPYVTFKVKNHGEENYLCDFSSMILPDESGFRVFFNDSYVTGKLAFIAGAQIPSFNHDIEVRLKVDCSPWASEHL